MKIIVDKYSGKVLFASPVDCELQENQIALSDLPNGEFVKPYYNFETKVFYDGATAEEIAEATEPIEVNENEALKSVLKTVLNINDEQLNEIISQAQKLI